MPELRRLLVNDSPQSWQIAGFSVNETRSRVGGIDISFGETSSGQYVEWQFTGLDPTITEIDGIPTRSFVEQAPDKEPATKQAPDIQPKHSNGVSRIDHVVMTTDNLERTIGALEAAGFGTRKHRDVPGSGNRQVFLWAGETILEVVGPVSRDPVSRYPMSKDPISGDSKSIDPGKASQGAKIWGLALTSSDLDKAARSLRENISAPKPAVQPGRRIATIATQKIGIRMAIALMTPHISPAGTD